MSREKLEPGDIVECVRELGLVMRNDDEGLLIAYPGFDELTIGVESETAYVTTIYDRRPLAGDEDRER